MHNQMNEYFVSIYLKFNVVSQKVLVHNIVY